MSVQYVRVYNDHYFYFYHCSCLYVPYLEEAGEKRCWRMGASGEYTVSCYVDAANPVGSRRPVLSTPFKHRDNTMAIIYTRKMIWYSVHRKSQNTVSSRKKIPWPNGPRARHVRSYASRKAQGRTAVGTSDAFGVTVGVQQGSALRPLLFIVVMDCLSDEMR